MNHQNKSVYCVCIFGRCGSTVVSAHSCVLASVSQFFGRLVRTKRSGSDVLDVDVGQLFRGLEGHFASLVDALYQGKRLVSRPVEQLTSDVQLVGPFCPD